MKTLFYTVGLDAYVPTVISRSSLFSFLPYQEECRLDTQYGSYMVNKTLSVKHEKVLYSLFALPTAELVEMDNEKYIRINITKDLNFFLKGSLRHNLFRYLSDISTLTIQSNPFLIVDKVDKSVLVPITTYNFCKTGDFICMPAKILSDILSLPDSIFKLLIFFSSHGECSYALSTILNYFKGFSLYDKIRKEIKENEELLKEFGITLTDAREMFIQSAGYLNGISRLVRRDNQ